MLELAYLFVLWIRNLFWDRIIALDNTNKMLHDMCGKPAIHIQERIVQSQTSGLTSSGSSIYSLSSQFLGCIEDADIRQYHFYQTVNSGQNIDLITNIITNPFGMNILDFTRREDVPISVHAPRFSFTVINK